MPTSRFAVVAIGNQGSDILIVVVEGRVHRPGMIGDLPNVERGCRLRSQKRLRRDQQLVPRPVPLRAAQMIGLLNHNLIKSHF